MSTQYIRYPANISSSSFPLLAPDGSASAPSYSFANASDTGMFLTGTTLAFSAAGTSALTISNAQLVTIGVSGTTTLHKINGRLNVAHGGANAAALVIENTTTEDAFTTYKVNGSTTHLVGVDYSASQSYIIGQGATFASYTPAITVDGTAAVTIGASSGTLQHTIHGKIAQSLNWQVGSTSAPSSAVLARVTSGSSGITSGTVQYGLYLDSFFSSTATILATGIGVQVSTQNASFTTSQGSAFVAFAANKGTSNTITRLFNYYGSHQTAGTNNIWMGDNTTMTGNWTAHFSSTNPALFGGSFIIGTAALSTSATDGFLYLPSCAGAPTGTPTSRTGTVASVYDSTNNRIYVYNGSWRSVTLT